MKSIEITYGQHEKIADKALEPFNQSPRQISSNRKLRCGPWAIAAVLVDVSELIVIATRPFEFHGNAEGKQKAVEHSEEEEAHAYPKRG
jgi:hypothetical protein